MIGVRDVRYQTSTECFDILGCKRCGLMITSLAGRPVDPQGYYSADYGAFSERATPSIQGSSSALRNRLEVLLLDHFHVAIRRLAVLRALNLAPGSRVMDLGCGSGGIGHALIRELGCEVSGIEPSPEAAERARARGMKVFVGAAEDFDPTELFDAVIMIHALEHLSRPRRVLLKVHEMLKPGGRLMIAIPNTASLERWLFRQAWDAWDVPRHTCHFSPRSLRAILRETGFDPGGVYFEVYSLFGRSLSNRLLARVPYQERKSRYSWRPFETAWGAAQALLRRSSAMSILATRESRDA